MVRLSANRRVEPSVFTDVRRPIFAKGEDMYQQTYDPLGNALLSTVAAAVPIATLLYFIALHRHRDAQGNVHLGISAPYAAFFGVIAAFVVACLVFRMPVTSAV